MDITPVKIIQDTTQCFLCRFEPPSSDERVKVFGKSSLDIPGLVNSASAPKSLHLRQTTCLFARISAIYHNQLEDLQKYLISDS
jgi:hypothetical protein